MRKPTVKYLGRVALVRVPLGFEVDLHSLAEEIMKRNTAVKTVLLIERVEGPFRLPVVRHLAGDTDTETVVKEEGIVYRLDAAKLMFSLGNSFERKRMHSLPRPGETVVDMFAGVGQFTIPIAKSPASKVFAFEINPQAYRYLLDNIRINKVEEKVTPFNVDCRRALEHVPADAAERVVMGYLRGTADYFETALKLTKPDGAIIHFHELGDSYEGWSKLYQLCREKAEQTGYDITLVGKRGVKTFSPSTTHWVLDLLCRRKPFLEPFGDLGEDAATGNVDD